MKRPGGFDGIGRRRNGAADQNSATPEDSFESAIFGRGGGDEAAANAETANLNAANLETANLDTANLDTAVVFDGDAANESSAELPQRWFKRLGTDSTDYETLRRLHKQEELANSVWDADRVATSAVAELDRLAVSGSSRAGDAAGLADPSHPDAPLAVRAAKLRQRQRAAEQALDTELAADAAAKPSFLSRLTGGSVAAAKRDLRRAKRDAKRRTKQQRRRFLRYSRRTKRRLLIAGAIVALTAGAVAIGVLTPIMSVKEIRVEGVTTLDAGTVEAALDPLRGTPLALVDEQQVFQSLGQFNLIQRYAIEIVPPQTLIVRVQERVPVISMQSAEGYRVLDAAGVQVAETPELLPGAPLAQGELTDVTSPAFAAATRALRDMDPALREQFIAVSATTANDITFAMGSGLTVLWGDDSQNQLKGVLLQQMIAALGGREISLIDVSSTEAPVFQ